MKKKHSLFFPFFLLSVITLTAFFIRIRLLQLPLDRDEGEYAYAGWRMIHGGVPFLDYYNMKMPGIYAFYALLFLIFSPTIATIRLGLLLVNLGNTALMFQLSKKLGSTRSGIYSSICYLIFSLQLEFQGMNSYAEHFAVLFVIAGVLLFLSGQSRKQNAYYFFSGLLLGIAFLMKQPSFAFIIFIGLLVIIESLRQRTAIPVFLKKIGLAAMGSAFPLLVTFFILYHFGALHNFRLFAFQYAQEYVSYNNWHYGLNNCIGILKDAIKPNAILWLLMSASVILIFTAQKNASLLFIILFLVFSFIAVSAGFYFRPHYFQFLVPAISLLAGTTLTLWEDLSKAKISKHLSIIFLSIGAFYFFWNQRLYFFSMDEQTFIRKNYHFDLFNVTKRVGDFVSQHCKTNATVAIFGAEPEIWFYAKRKGASGYMYVYPLLEDQKYAEIMLAQFHEEIIKNKPDILVYTSLEGTWYASENRHQRIVDWYKAYRDASFKRVGLIEMINDSVTKYYWNNETANHPINEENYIEIDERK